MLRNALFFLFLVLPCLAKAELPTNGFQTTEEILASVYKEKPTSCASQIFSAALMAHSDEISETDDEQKVQSWARITLSKPSVLEQLLQCPEVASIDETTTIVFTPIVYEFDNGRTITIKYSTQPKVLRQKLILSRKRSLPDGNPNPMLMNPDDTAKYLNTEPAWYGILVVQHDSLSEFVGPEKNNTVSVKYINDNISKIYPKGYYCTSKSALANDNDTINRVVHNVVDIEDDTNDYYIAGDVDLGWIMYAEIAADIIITVATAGIGEAAMLGAKGARAGKTGIQLAKNITKLKQFKNVEKYIQNSRKLELLENYSKGLKNLEKARKSGKDVLKAEKELQEIASTLKRVDPSITEQMLKNADTVSKQIENATKEIEKLTSVADQIKDKRKLLDAARKNGDAANVAKLTNEIDELESVEKYLKNAKQLDEILKYRRELRAFRRPQTGNIITRNLKKIGAFGKTLKAANNGSKILRKSGRVARAGLSSRSARISSWLMDETLKHGSRLARFERDAGLLYGAVSFLADMYDYTSTTSKEFSNGIEFKPLCLLSADDLKGQENVVNYGMWLMWTGNSTDAADDDSAYLQATDFASKFFYELDEYQDEHSAQCNVDIYVVRPIIRLDETNTDNPSGELFYLFMNEIPWSTAEQFNIQNTNINDWERMQSDLTQQDPENKYHNRQTEINEQEQYE